MVGMASSNSTEYNDNVLYVKRKNVNFDNMPLLSARDIREWLSFVIAKQMTEEDVIGLIYARHRRRQRDINYCFSKRFC